MNSSERWFLDEKRIWGLLVLIVLFSFGMNTYAKDTLENEAENKIGRAHV